jgi:hypothetical protein
MRLRPVLIIASLMFLCLPINSWATLGQTSTTITTDAKALNASMSLETRLNYQIYTLALANGTATIVEYYAPISKQVFAISWRAKLIPNLHQVLGNYFSRLQASPTQVVHHSQASISQDDFLAEYGGLRGAYYGKVVLLQQLPAGVSAGEIK